MDPRAVLGVSTLKLMGDELESTCVVKGQMFARLDTAVRVQHNKCK